MADLSYLRRRILDVAYKAGEGHIPSSYSVLEILWTLHHRVMTPDCRFILSKGHASLALYAVLEDLGRIPAGELDRFCQPGSKLMGHPERMLEWGIEATTGSLGHGFPVAVGLAYGMRLKGSTGRVFCLVGDQELNEGACFESMLIAAHHKLSNLTLIVDNNESGEKALRMDSIPAKFLAFNWQVATMSGHSVMQIEKALAHKPSSEPICVIAHTIKGFGCPEMAKDARAWHHRVPKDDAEMARMMEQIQ